MDGMETGERIYIEGELVSTKQRTMFERPCHTNLDGSYASIDTDGDGEEQPIQP